MVLVFLVIVMLIAPANMAAQNPNAKGFAAPPTTFDFNRDMLGNWEDTNGFGGGNCGSLKDERGNPRTTCQFPVDKLEPLMNERAKAWQKFFDEPLSPKWYCVAGNVTTELADGYLWSFSANSDAVLQHFEQGNWTRFIWVDGRPHPPNEQVFYQGHAIGRMEGDDFVVETTNFAFDPDGLDDQSHIATSHMKKQIERYHVTGKGKMHVDITVEDPLFFKAPFTFTVDYRKATRDWTYEWQCDPDVALHHLYSTAGQKYADDEMFKKYKD